MLNKTFNNISCHVFTWFCLLFIAADIQAQPVLGTRNISLGGGGTAYINGPEATFWNPANLMINDRAGNFHFSLGQAGIIHEPVLAPNSLRGQAESFLDTFFYPHVSDSPVTEQQRTTLLDNNYPRNSVTSQHLTRADALLAGAHWQKKNSAFSITARARMGSHIETGRGWYSEDYFTINDRSVRDMTISKRKSQLYELSFGYAQEFTLFDGLFSHLSKLYVGVAPKFIVSGPSLDFSYEAQFVQPEETTPLSYEEEFRSRSSSAYSSMIESYRAGQSQQEAIGNNFNRIYNVEPSGYGGAVDFGMTYLIPLGGDLSPLSPGTGSVVKQSLRFALSVNDIGFISYQKEPLEILQENLSTPAEAPGPQQTIFTGADGQITRYFDSTETIANPLFTSSEVSSGNFITPTPASVNGGMLLELSRIKVMSDLTLGLDNTAFTSKKLKVHLGMEIRPLPQIPIRAGTQMVTDQPIRLAAGTGFETRYWDFNIGSQIFYRSGSSNAEISAATVAALQFHL